LEKSIRVSTKIGQSCHTARVAKFIIASYIIEAGNMGQEVRMAIVGCGAVTEQVYLPVLSGLPKIKTVLLVDKNLPRAKKLASKFNIPNVTDDFHQVPEYANSSIIAVPHNLHAPIAIYLLNHGIHLLVEKPMAITVSECKTMIEVAHQHNCVLAVGLIRRFYASSLFIKNFISGGFLGSVYKFDVREGNSYNWPVASDFFFRKEMGGGVLLDTGAHTLDLLLWWLGDWKDVKYFDNAHGGVESDCELHLTLKSGAKGIVELSRTRNLRNTFQIYGEKGKVEVGVGFDPEVILDVGKDKTYLRGYSLFRGKSKLTFQDMMKLQLEDFVSAIQEDHLPLVPGVEGERAIRLIETCRTNRIQLSQPWLEYEHKQDLQKFGIP